MQTPPPWAVSLAQTVKESGVNSKLWFHIKYPLGAQSVGCICTSYPKFVLVRLIYYPPSYSPWWWVALAQSPIVLETCKRGC
jgi:hypothetical protein